MIISKEQNLLLIIVAIILILLYYKPTNNAKVFYPKSLPFNFNGMTVAPFGIFIKRSQKNNIALLEHEKIHWQQYQKMGLLKYIYTYTKEHFTNGYDGNKMEIEARQNESNYCKKKYSECVRNGRAKTVKNSKFRI